jgi:hypothetical protein
VANIFPVELKLAANFFFFFPENEKLLKQVNMA